MTQIGNKLGVMKLSMWMIYHWVQFKTTSYLGSKYVR